jgi:hypothetical protein
MKSKDPRFIIFSYSTEFDSGNYPLKLDYSEDQDIAHLHQIIRNLQSLNKSSSESKTGTLESKQLNGVFKSVKKENQNEINRLKSEILDYMKKEKKLKKQIESLKKELKQKKEKPVRRPTTKRSTKAYSRLSNSKISKKNSLKKVSKYRTPKLPKKNKKILNKSITRSIRSRASSCKSRNSRKSSRSRKNSRFWNDSYIERKSQKSISRKSKKNKSIISGRSVSKKSRNKLRTKKKKTFNKSISQRSKRRKKISNEIDSKKSDFKTRKKRRRSAISSDNSFEWSEDSIDLRQKKFQKLQGCSNKERNKINLLNAKLLNLKLKRNQLRSKV